MIIVLISIDVEGGSVEGETDSGGRIVGVVRGTAREKGIRVVTPCTGVRQCCEVIVFDGVVRESGSADDVSSSVSAKTIDMEKDLPCRSQLNGCRDVVQEHICSLLSLDVRVICQCKIMFDTGV